MLESEWRMEKEVIICIQFSYKGVLCVRVPNLIIKDLYSSMN